MAQKQFFSGVATSCASAITNIQTSITGQSTSTWPSSGDYVVQIQGFAPGTSTGIFENVLVTANNQGTGVLTVTRAQDGTGAQAFAAGATLTPIISLKMITDAMARLDNNGIQLPTTIGGSLPTTGYGTVPVKIDDILVGTDSRYLAATPQITFLNTSGSGTNLLPTGFRHLLVEWYARGDAAAGSVTLAMRFNNVSTATYDHEYQQTVGTTTQVPVEGLGQTSMFLGLIPAATATANYFGAGESKIKHYQGAVGQKAIFSDSALITGDTGSNTQRFVATGKWRTTATAVTRIDLVLSSGNAIVGSLFTLYGIP